MGAGWALRDYLFPRYHFAVDEENDARNVKRFVHSHTGTLYGSGFWANFPHHSKMEIDRATKGRRNHGVITE